MWNSSFENSLFNSGAHFSIGMLTVWELSFCSSLQILDISPLLDELLATIFCHSFDCLLSLVTVSFAVQKVFVWIESYLFILSLRCWAFWILLRKSFPIPMCSTVFPTSSWRFFKVSGLILRCLIDFELILVQRERQGTSFIHLHTDIQISQQHLVNKLSFLNCVVGYPSSKISWI
jgi:hypothetical protein